MIDKIDSLDEDLTVFCNGACPLCNLETSFYKRQRGFVRLNWLEAGKGYR
jgi:hypothetical protein